MLHGTMWLLFAAACAHSGGGGSSGSGSGGGGSGSTGGGAASCTGGEGEADVAACAGKTVTLRGVVSRTKIPTLLGVDIGDGESLADQPAEATGVLESYTEPEQPADGLQRAGRGPGTYWRLRGDDGLAKARPL